MDHQVLVHNHCGREKIHLRYEPLIAATVAAYLAFLGDRVVEIRVSGSVVRGEDEPGRSDIDFVALVAGLADETEVREELDKMERTLHEAHPVACRVDLMALPANDLPAFPRFVLASDSASVYGVDTLTKTAQTFARDELASLVTADAGALIRDYREWVEGLVEGSDDEDLRRASRVIGKDLLRCARRLALVRGGGYEQNLDRIYDQVLTLVPELDGLTRELHDLKRNPTTEKQALLHALNRAERELIPLAASSG